MKTVGELKKELHRRGIKTYYNKKTKASYIKKADVKKVFAETIKLTSFELTDDGEGWMVEYTGPYKEAAQDVADNSEGFFNLRAGADEDSQQKLENYASEYEEDIKEIHIEHYMDDDE